MRNESELTVDITRARNAQEFINNPLFIEGMAILKATTLDKFESLNYNQVKEMVECNRMLKTIDRFESLFSNTILTGDAALNALNDINEHNKAINNER